VRLVTGAIADACVYGMARRRDFQSAREGGQGSGRSGNEPTVVYSNRRSESN
jgi:hypothetical protein